jgi:hypothetical protein
LSAAAQRRQVVEDGQGSRSGMGPGEHGGLALAYVPGLNSGRHAGCFDYGQPRYRVQGLAGSVCHTSGSDLRSHWPRNVDLRTRKLQQVQQVGSREMDQRRRVDRWPLSQG